MIFKIGFLLLLIGQGLGGGPVYKTSVNVQVVPSIGGKDQLTTQTVYGFLDFTTTIANTVMIFTPQSQQAENIKPSRPAESLKTEPPSTVKHNIEIKPSRTVQVSSEKIVNSKVSISKPKIDQQIKLKPLQQSVHESKSVSVSEQVKTNVNVRKKVTTTENKPVQLKPKDNPISENNLEPSEQSDLLKQASGKVTETFKVREVESIKSRNEPTGLVTKLGGTVVKDGVTTVHETSVVGTYISGKYAQVLKSSSHVINRPTKPPILLLKSRHPDPSVLEDSLPLEALFTTSAGQNLIRHSRRPSVSPPFKNKLQRTKVHEAVTSEPPTKKKHTSRSFKISHNRFSRTTSVSDDIPTVSVFSETVQPTRRYRQRSASASSSITSNNIETGSRKFKPKPSPVQTEPSTSLYKFKLARPQARDGRWQYKASPKPRVAIRRQDEDSVVNSIVQPTPSLVAVPELEQSEYVSELEASETAQIKQTPSLSIHTIRVDISTPANFSNTYYEIATIKSPYTFQVGTVKNTRYITLTSTLEKLLQESTSSININTEPLTENILTSTPVFEKEAPIVTLPVINIAAGESLPLETMTDTFSTSETLLKTHLLPVVRDSNTTTITLVQTYEVTKVVSATKTLPPTELFQFIPSKTLNEFNTRLDEAGSELHLELEFGDSDNDEGHSVAVLPDRQNFTTEHTPVSTPQTPQEQLTPEKLQQLAFLRLLNPNQPPLLTSSSVISLETLYESHVIPFFNGLSTVLSTISRPVKTVTKTDFITGTVPIPSLPIPFLPTPQIQQQALITSSPIIQQTIVTQTDSKILKLTFGAKTAYTTLYSTRVVPTLLTTYITSQLAVQPTIPAFPQYFPPFNPFSFVG